MGSLCCSRVIHAGSDPARTRADIAKYKLDVPGARLTSNYDEMVTAADVDIVSIASPNHLHAEQAVAAAKAGKHFLLEKPTGLDIGELVQIRDAVRRAGVRTIVSFELRYNPFLKCAHWLQSSGQVDTSARSSLRESVRDKQP